jgi:hypothetical protein
MAYPRTVDQVMNEIDLATEPSVMSKQSALEFLEQCCTELEGRIEALRDEISEE